MNKLRLFLLSGFGLGLMPFAPGTFGSLPPAIVLIALLAWGANAVVINIAMAATLVVFSAVCILTTPWAERYFGRKDPGNVVSDEIAAIAMMYLFLPWRTGEDALHFTGEFTAGPGFWNISIIVAGFVFFRIFDITKPPPARALEKLPSGWGMLMDDLMAAIYAMVLLQLFVRVALPAIG